MPDLSTVQGRALRVQQAVRRWKHPLRPVWKFTQSQGCIWNGFGRTGRGWDHVNVALMFPLGKSNRLVNCMKITQYSDDFTRSPDTVTTFILDDPTFDLLLLHHGVRFFDQLERTRLLRRYPDYLDRPPWKELRRGSKVPWIRPLNVGLGTLAWDGDNWHVVPATQAEKEAKDGRGIVAGEHPVHR